MWDVKMRKRLVLLQSLAVLMAVFQYGQRATGQEKGGDSNRILSNFFHPSLTARIPLAGSAVGEWLAATARVNRARIRVRRRRTHRRYRRMPLRKMLPLLIRILYIAGIRTARGVWCFCSHKLYLYQLILRSVLFYALTEYGGLVNQMLLMISGDVESNPGPGTVLKLDDLRGLEILLQPVSAYWISIADQLGMASQVPIIQSTPTPPTFMRDLLHRWLIREHPSPTLEALCQALRGDAEIIGGAGVARKLEEMFQGRRGDKAFRPTLVECVRFRAKDRRINIPQEIGTKYMEFGVLLLEDSTGARVRVIELQNHYDTQQINLWILQEWLIGTGRHPVTWNTLVEVLHDIELPTLASEIEAVKCQTAQQSDLLGNSRHLFNEAMKYGYVMSRNTTVLFLGAAGSGKTCTKHVLMNELPPKERESTPIAERPVKVYKLLTDKDFRWHKLSPAEQKEILAGIIRSRGEMKPTTESSISSLPKPKSPLPKLESSLPKPESSLPKPEMAAGDHMAPPSITEEEFVTLLDELTGTSAEPLTEVDVVYITDSGGQPQFHEVLPVFLGDASVCIFVTKLSECFDAQPLVEYYHNDRTICKPQLAAQTNQQILKHCVRAMRSHKCEGKLPKIVFIGTFKDLEHKCSETRAAKNQKLLKMLLPHFKDEVIYSHLPTNELIFAFNAKDPGEDEWELAEGIRELIMTKCSPEPVEIPLRWYALDLALQALGKEVVSKDESFAEARKLHFDAESFDAALQYLDKLNIIFYHPKTLPNVVFTNRQVLLNKVTELVKESYMLRDKDSKVMPHSGDSRRFRDYALVTVDFLESFNTHYVHEGDLFTPHDLVKLFRALLIFADFTSTGEYFMPCLLQILSSQEVANHRSLAATVPLVLHFPHGGPRLGMFCSLTVFLLSAANQFPSPWKLAVDPLGTPVCLHRNCIKFIIAEYPCSIVLIDTFAFFEVYVDCPDELCPQLYYFIRKAVFAGLLEAASTLGYNNSQPKVAFLCSCPREELHLAIAEGSYWICTADPKRRTCLTLENKHKMWLTTCELPTAADESPVSSTQASCADADKELNGSDLPEISSYLDGMENSKILRLGMVLGLDFSKLKNNMMTSTTFLLDTIYSWLQKEDEVVTKGIPTWRALVNGLKSRGVRQTGIATEIAKDKGIE